jgi:hypothetical protein
MSLMDRIRELFDGRQTGAEYGTVAGASGATADDEPDAGMDSGGGGDFSGGGDGGGSSGGSGDSGGGSSGSN